MDNLNDLLGTTDATVWAQEFVDVLWSQSLTEEELLDLAVGWFANAFAVADSTQTAVQAIDNAISRASLQRIIVQHDDGATPEAKDAIRDFSIAITELENAAMRFTRGMAKVQGKFNPADLELDNGK